MQMGYVKMDFFLLRRLLLTTPVQDMKTLLCRLRMIGDATLFLDRTAWNWAGYRHPFLMLERLTITRKTFLIIQQGSWGPQMLDELLQRDRRRWQSIE